MGGRCQGCEPAGAFGNPAGAAGYWPCSVYGLPGGFSDMLAMLSPINDSGIQLLAADIRVRVVAGVHGLSH